MAGCNSKYYIKSFNYFTIFPTLPTQRWP